MNKDQAKGVVKDIVGRVQQSAGKLIGSKEQQMKGLQRQVVGKAEKHLGDAKEVIRSTRDAVKAAVKI